MGLAYRVGAVMKEVFEADKVNTAAIGNVVQQLHIHVIARREDDTAWPAPVWGNGTMIAMDDDLANARIKLLQDELGLKV